MPGVPTGSIYNTDTSYAIAKKSGVLTVSEPQQTANVEFQTYVGNGKHGRNDPSYRNQLTFSNAPKAVVIVIGNAQATNDVMFKPGQTGYSIVVQAKDHVSGVVNWTNDNKTVEWYCTAPSGGASDAIWAMGQMNSKGTTYVAYAVY